jgi:hypothetical protein
MSERVVRLFRVRCGNCERTLMTVSLLGSDEIASCFEHVRACWPYDPLPKQPLLGDLMRLLRITIVGTASEVPARLQ